MERDFLLFKKGQKPSFFLKKDNSKTVKKVCFKDLLLKNHWTRNANIYIEVCIHVEYFKLLKSFTPE